MGKEYYNEEGKYLREELKEGKKTVKGKHLVEGMEETRNSKGTVKYLV